LEINNLVKPGDNHLELKVVNFWINRMIGDEPLVESGLIGPVMLSIAQ
jgi:hypothetical protein